LELYGTSFITIITQFVLDHYYAGLPISKATENGVEIVNIKHTKGTKSNGNDKLINVENLKFSDRQVSLSSIIKTIPPKKKLMMENRVRKKNQIILTKETVY
jgi:hypothetical protein